jgi:hypothetical protein
MARPSSYPPELRRRAVHMVAEVLSNYPNESAALRAVGLYFDRLWPFRLHEPAGLDGAQ